MSVKLLKLNVVYNAHFPLISHPIILFILHFYHICFFFKYSLLLRIIFGTWQFLFKIINVNYIVEVDLEVTIHETRNSIFNSSRNAICESSK